MRFQLHPTSTPIFHQSLFFFNFILCDGPTMIIAIALLLLVPLLDSTQFNVSEIRSRKKLSLILLAIAKINMIKTLPGVNSRASPTQKLAHEIHLSKYTTVSETRTGCQ